MINFPAQWHIKEFYNSNFFEFWIFCFKSLLWLFGSVFHGSHGSLAKCEEMRMIFFWRCHVWKITIFSQPRGGQKRHYFAQFFFSEYRFVITGWCIWGGLFEFFENLWWKNDKFFSTMTYWGIFRIQTFLNFDIFVLSHSYGYLGVYFMAPRVHWQNAKKLEWFFSRGVMCEKLPFFHSPRWSEKALFCTIFFSPNIDSDHRSVHLGWFIWVFWEFIVKKMINFPAQWHIKEF